MVAWKKLRLVAGVFSLLLLVLAGLTQGGNAMEVSFVNYHETPILSAAFNLELGALYSGTQLSANTPLQLKDEAGRVIPMMLGSDGESAWAMTPVSGQESLSLRVTAASSWALPQDILTAEVNSRRREARIFNGVLSAEYRNEEFSIYYGDREELVLSRFTMHKGYWGAPAPAYRDETSPEGWIRVFRSASQIVDITAEIKQSGAGEIVITRRFTQPETVQNVVYKEILTLLPFQPIIEYRAVFQNQSDVHIFLGGRNNGFSTYLQGPLRGPKEVLRGNGEDLGEGRLGWFDPRWFSAITQDGYGVIFSDLVPDIPGSHYKDFHRASFDRSDERVHFSQAGITYGAPDMETWVYVPPGEQEVIGIGVHLAAPGQHVRDDMARNWDALSRGESMWVHPAAAIFQAELPVQASAASTLYLQPEMIGTEGYMAALDMDFSQPIQVRLGVDQIDPESVLSVKVRAFGQDSWHELLVAEQVGEYDVNVSAVTGWTQRLPFVLAIELAGDGSASLSELYVGAGTLPPPRLVSPLNEVDITDLAAFFTWEHVSGSGQYQLQLSRTSDFSEPVTYQVAPFTASGNVPLYTGIPYFFPEESLADGLWYWRVRAIQFNRYETEGAWSSVRTFTVNTVHKPAPPIRNISPQDPFIGLKWQWSLDKNAALEQVSQVVRPYVVLHEWSGSGYGREPDFYGMLEYAHEHGINIMLNSFRSLAEMEYAYQRYPNVMGFWAGERFYSLFVDLEEQEFLRRAVQLAVKYGRFVVWADHHRFGWQEFANIPGFISREHAPYFLPLFKTTEPYMALQSYGTIQGYWLSGLADNFGLQADSWFWASIGSRKLGEDDYGVRGGFESIHPPVAYVQHWLLAMMQGAAVFTNECGYVFESNRPNWLWTGYLEPFFRGAIENDLIPARQEVLDSTNIAVYGELPSSWDQYYRIGWAGPDYAIFAPLYREILGVTDPVTQLFPRTGRYGFIPVIPEAVDWPVEEDIEVISINALQRPEEIVNTFNQAYPDPVQGDALFMEIGDSLFIMNSNENQDHDQTYHIDFGQRGMFQAISGDISVHKYIVGKFHDNNRRLWLQANTSLASAHLSVEQLRDGQWDTRDTEVWLQLQKEPEVIVRPDTALKEQHWCADSGQLQLVLSHADGAVEVELREPGFAPGATETRVRSLGDFSLLTPGEADTELDPEALVFRWQPAASAHSYRLQVALDEGFDQLIVDTVVQSVVHRPSQLAFDRSYYWRVQALSVEAERWSEVRQFHTRPPVGVPKAPVLVSATAYFNQVQLHWHPGTDVESYVVYRDGQKVAEVSGQTTEYRDLVETGRSYNYSVRAENSLGVSPSSDTAHISLRSVERLLAEDFTGVWKPDWFVQGSWSFGQDQERSFASLRALFPRAFGSLAVSGVKDHLVEQDYILELQFRFTDWGNEQFSALRLASNMVDGDRYMILYQRTTGEIQLQKRSFARTVTLATAEWTPRLGYWYDLQFSREGTTLKLAIDGKELWAVNDYAPLKQGGVEIYANNIAIDFSKLQVSGY